MSQPSDRAIAQPPNEDALIALFESVYEREWDRAAEESDDRGKAILGPADEHATRMAVRAVIAAAAAPEGAQAVAWVVGAMPNAVHHYNEATAKAEAKRYGLPITALYEHPPSLGGEDAALREDAERYRWLRNTPGATVCIAGLMGGRISGAHADVEVDDARAAEGGERG